MDQFIGICLMILGICSIYMSLTFFHAKELKKHIDKKSSKNKQEDNVGLNNLPDIKTILKGKQGELRINLKWNSTDDLDLSVTDPCNNEINFKNRRANCNGSTGLLDADANADWGGESSPQENIFWGTNPPSGLYNVFVTHYKFRQSKNVNYILTLSAKGKNESFAGTAFQGEKSLVLEFSFSDAGIIINKKHEFIKQI